MQIPVTVISLVSFAMQKVVIVILLVIFVVKKLVIVRDWIILPDDHSNALIFEHRVLFSILLSNASTV